MKSTTEVKREIRRIVQERIDAGVIVRVEWLTTEIISTKDQIEGADADFYVACGVDFIKKSVKDVIGDYAPKPTQSAQILMDGFDHLQKAYTVQRDEQVTLVPVTMLTDAELETRANEYEVMAAGCIAHAEEIRAFILGREQGAA